MSKKMDEMLLKVKNFVWTSNEMDCGEKCPLSCMCSETEERSLIFGLCSVSDEEFLKAVREYDKDE